MGQKRKRTTMRGGMSEINFSSLVAAVAVLVAVMIGGAFAFPAILERFERRDHATAGPEDWYVWAISDSFKVLQNGTIAATIPQQGDMKALNGVWDAATKTITLQGVKKETLSVQIAVDAKVDLTGVDMEMSDLVNGSSIIPSASLPLFYEWYLLSPYTPRTLRPGALPRGYYPDALIPFTDPYADGQGQRIVQPFTIATDVTQPIWLDVPIPETATPGTYTGTLTVTATGETPIELTVNVTVLDVTLPDERPLAVDVGVQKYEFMRGIGVPGGMTLDNAYWDSQIWPQYVKLMRMARDHGFDSSPLLNPIEPPFTIDESTNAVTDVDWSEYDTYFGQILDGSIFPDGLPPKSWRLPNRSLGTWQSAPETLDPRDAAFIDSLAPLMEAHFQQKGWDLTHSYTIGIDEPQPNQYNTERQFGEALKAHSDLRLWLPFAPRKWGALDPSLLYGIVDFWMPKGMDFYPPLMEERRDLGELTGFYQSDEPGLGVYTINADGLGFRVWPWSAWKYDSPIFVYWSGTHNDPDAPFVVPDANQTDYGIGEGTLFYPGKKLSTIGFSNVDGPLSSVRMKALRRGLQDTKLFKILRDLHEETFVDDAVSSVLQSSLCEDYDPEGRYGGGHEFFCPRDWEDDRYGDLMPSWEKDADHWDAVIRDIRERATELLAPCVEDWECDAEWGACVDGIQTRSCIDQNDCGTTTFMPPTEQVCTVPCVEQWQCDDWGACSSEGIQTRACTDEHACGTTVDRPPLQQACTPPCIENWSCDADWGACVDGSQTRSCTDLNTCGTTEFQPDLSQSCTLPCTEAWECTGWSSCVDGIQTQSCFDRHDCGTTADRPPLEQACTACQEQWVCDADWGACVDGIETRACSDTNGCGTTADRPPLEQACGSGGSSDTEPPDTSFVSTPHAFVKQPATTVSWAGTDAVSETRNLNYTWRLDAGPWSPYDTTTSATLTRLTNGSHTVSVRALDEAGNEDPSPAEASFTVAFDPIIVTANRSGAEPRIRVAAPDGTLRKQFLVFPKSFRGGMTVAVGDLGVDGIPEIVIGSGPGRAPEVRVFDQNGRLLTKFNAFTPSFRGGVSVAVGNVDGGTADIVVAPLSEKGSNVRVFSWHSGGYRPSTRSVNVYGERFQKGIAVAAGDLDGDGVDEIVATPLRGTPHLRVFGVRRGSLRSVLPGVNVFAGDFKGGVSVAAADVDGDHDDDIVVGVAAQGRSSMRWYGRSVEGSLTLTHDGITAFHPNYQGGISVAAADLDGDGRAESVAAIRNAEKPYVRVLTDAGRFVREFFGAKRSMKNGLTVAAGS